MNDHRDDPNPPADPSRPGDGDASRASDEPTAEQDLRATADAIRSDLRRLAAVEDDKQRLHPADARIDELSDEAVALADRIQRETRAERQLADEIG